MRIWRSLRRSSARRRTPAPDQTQTSWVVRRADQRRERDRRADVWRGTGEPTAERIQAEYERRKDLLDERLRPWARPLAAWTLADGVASVTSSHMGGRPAMYPDEPWPGGDSDPMRFWAQVNLADLAPYAQAFDVAMPSAGLVQLFAGDEGGELARYLPATDLRRLQLRERIPIGYLWAEVDDAEEMHRRSLLIDLYPEALVPWQEMSHIVIHDDPAPVPYTTSEDLPGYSFGWWPFSSWPLRDGLHDWPPARPKPRPEDWVFLAVCDSNDDLGLAFSDAGFLWATVPARDLADGDFEQLRCDGESS